jgi:hypothetical protein
MYLILFAFAFGKAEGLNYPTPQWATAAYNFITFIGLHG